MIAAVGYPSWNKEMFKCERKVKDLDDIQKQDGVAGVFSRAERHRDKFHVA